MKNIKIMLKKITLIIILLTVAVRFGFSQSLSNYAVNISYASFNTLAGGTNPALTAGNADDGYFNNIPVGFDYWYMGSRYTTIAASTNGWLTPSGIISSSTPVNNLNNGGASRPIFAPLWDDLNMQAATNISYLTTGLAGNRIFTIQYLNARWSRTATGNSISFQVKIYEGSGKIEYIYRQETGALVNASASIGFSAVPTGTGNFLSINNAGTGISSTIETNNINSKPFTGQTGSFLPPIPTAPGSLSFTDVTSNSTTLNWTDNSNNEVGFVIYRSTDGVSYSFVTQTSVNATSSIQNGLTANTTYYWRVCAVTEGGLSTAINGTQITLCVQPAISQVPQTGLIANYLLNGNASDFTGNNPGFLQNGPSTGPDRFNLNNKSYSFNGATQYISTSNAYNNPTDFTISLWFKTNTTTGGKLIGFGNTQTGQSSNYDRHIYMNNNGQLYFGVYPNTVVTVNSALSYNDNSWHLASATFSSITGMALYVDGILAGANTVTTTAQNYSGYWRIGYDNNSGWTSQPSNYYFNGLLDDVLIYQRALSAGEINTLYNSPDGAGNNGPVCSGATLSLSATTLSGVTYAWTGPNGFTSSLQNPTLNYLAANAGVYTLQVTSAGCTSTAFTNVKSTTTTGQWTGAVSTDWADVNNWCSGILPTSLIDVTINASATRMPTISNAASCRKLTINAGAVVTTSIAGTLNIAGNLVNNGTMTNGGTTVFNGTGGQQNFTGVTNFYNFTLNNTSGLIIPAATTIVNNLTLSAGIFNSNSFSILVGGNFINTSSNGAYFAGQSTVFFNGTGPQSIGGSFVTNFNDINIANATNVVSLNRNITVGGDLSVSAGTLDLGVFTANRTTAGGILTISNNATLKIGGTNQYPLNYTTNTLVVASTVEYNGTNQTVSNQPYGNLKLTTSAGAAVKNLPATALIIAGKLISNVGNGTSVTFTAASNINVGDTILIGASTTFNGGSFTTSVGGAWVNNGTFNGNTGTVSFVGAGKTVGGAGAQNFNNLTVAAALVSFANASLTITGNLATTGAGSFIQVSGGTLTMTGTGTTISGTGISIDNLTVTGTVTSTASLTITGNLAVSGSFTGTTGVISLTGSAKTMTGAGTLNFNSLSISGSNTTTANFSIGSALIVGGTFTATAGIATFTGSSTLSGIANLFNTTINGTSLQLSANATLGVANTLAITSGTLNTSSSTPNTINFNGTNAQSVNAISFNNLTLSGGNTKTAAGAITVNRNINIATATTLVAGNFTHNVHGNWINAGVFTAGGGTIQFSGSQTQNIIGATTFNTVTVNHTTATSGLVLQNNIAAATLNMTQGNMLTGANTLTISTTRTGPGIILGNIQRTHAFTTGIAYAFEGPDNSITFTAATGVTSITVSVVKSSILDFPLNSSIGRVYNIAVPAGTYTATLRLHYEDDELNGNVENSMSLWKYNGTTWNSSGKTGNNTVSNYVEQSGLSDIINRWTLSDAINSVRWNGIVSSDWNTAANWTVIDGSATRPPSAADNVNIGDTLFVNQPVISNTVTVKSIVLNSTKAVNLSMAIGGTLTIGDISGTWGGNATHTINANNQNININGDLLLSNGTIGRVINLNIGTGNIAITGSLDQTADAGIVFSGAGTISVGGNYNYVSGSFNGGTGTFTYNGSSNQIVGAVNYNNITVNKTGGIATMSNTLTIGGNLLVSNGEMANETTTTIAGNATIASGAVLSNIDILKVGGNWLNNGLFIGSGNIIFNGVNTQTISSSTFNNLEINKPVGSTAVLTGAVTLKGNLTGTSGTLDISNYFFNRDVLGGTATISDSATLLIGVNNAPNKFSSYALSSGSTIVFNGADTQHLLLPGVVYGNLTFRNAGNKLLYTPITVMGKLLIENTARFSAGSNTITLYGNWQNDGTFLPQTSTVVCAGTGKTIAGNTTFNKMDISGIYSFLSDITFNDKLTITTNGAVSSGGSITTTLNGDLLNSGDLYSLGTTTFTGNVAQTLSLINAVRTVALTVNFNGSVPPVLISTSVPQFGFLNINNTGGVSPSVGWTVLYAMTVGTGASFNGGVSSHIINGSFVNNGTVTSTGTISFLPATSATINLGTNFSSTGRVYFGGAGAVTMTGSPVSFSNVNVTNTNIAGITPSSNWLLTNTLSIVSGSILNAGNYNYTIGGNILVNGTLNKGTSTFILNGTGSQDIFSASAFNNVTLNKVGDSTTLSSNITVSGNLNFIAGKIHTGAYSVSVPSGGVVTGAAQNTGWVYGKLQKNAATGATTRTFEIGDYTNFTPVTVAFTNVTTSGDLTASTTGTEHPNINTSTINATKSLNRYWTLTNNGILYNNYAATFNYVSGDLDAGATATTIDLDRYNGSSWIIPITTIRNSTNITATGFTNFGDFTAGEICNKGTTITYTGSPYCTEGGTAIVTFTGTTGGVFSADAGLAINTTTGNINLASSTPGTYTVTYTIAATGSCTQFITNTTISVAIAGTWTGSIDNNWSNAGNWACGGVPTAITNVTIPRNLALYPTINTSVAVNNINIENSSLLVVTGTLQIGGSISNAGSFLAAAGSIEMTGSNSQVIPADAFENNAVNNLIINNSSVAGVSLGGPLDIYRSLTYNGTGKTFVTNDVLTLKSTAINTAWVGDMTGNIITGKVTVERFISAHKAWRFLSVPTNTLQTFKETWQEAGISSSDDLSAGYGIQITSNRPTWAADGFDSGTPAPSIKTYDTLTNNYVGITSTNNTIKTAVGYMTFVRGDRTVISTSTAPTQTILRTTGSLYTGDQPTINVSADKFSSIGNPYASALDVRNITKAGLRDFYYLWDPNIGGLYGLGGYQVLSKDVTNNYVITPGGGSFGTAGSVNNIIQSGQAFFMQAGATGGTLTFKEEAKAEGSSLVSFTSLTGAAPANLRVTLHAVNADSSTHVADGLLVNFEDGYSNALDDFDAAKSYNTAENLSVKRDNKLLIIERRTSVSGADTIFLNFANAKLKQYSFTISTVDLYQPGLTGYLEDAYLNTATALNLNGLTTVNFSVQNIAGSNAVNRFKIVFKPATVLPLTFTSIDAVKKDKNIAVNWKTTNEINIEKHEVEKSTDGAEFIKVYNIVAKNNIANSYDWLDENTTENFNYYRIKSISVNGQIAYSKVVKVWMGQNGQMIVYPNPIINNTIQLRIGNAAAGIYTVRLLNYAGQEQIKTQFKHIAGTLIEFIYLNKNTAKGSYKLQIIAADGTKTTIPVAILK